MKRLISIFFIFSIGCTIQAQNADTLSLFDCYQRVRENAPQLNQLTLAKDQLKVEQKKYGSSNLPQISLYGKAWYQSDAIDVSFPPPINASIAVDQFQYNTAVNIDQKLFDGGITRVQKDLARIQADITTFETEVGLHKLSELVNSYFFSILSISKTKSAMELKLKSLLERKSQVSSGVEHGMVLPSELERLEAEILSAEQQISEIEMGVDKIKTALKILIGIKSDDNIFLVVPDKIFVVDSLSRPEISLFDANRKYVEKAKSIQDKRYLPRMAAYGQAGYSYPGLNFFENGPAPFYMVGLKLSWNIFDGNVAKTEKQLLEIKKKQVDIKEQDFRRNLQVQIENTKTDISNLNGLIEKDSSIINSRIKITKSSESALDNGVITTADYLNDLNAELKTRIEYEIHKVKLMETQAHLALIMGIK